MSNTKIKGSGTFNSTFRDVGKLVKYNDNPDITDGYRERKLREFGKEKGIKFSFKG